jgi:ceramide glucosyltransferase
MRRMAEVWKRQARWARLRRASFPLHFAPEILSGGLVPAISVAFVAVQTGCSVPGALLVFVALWYGAELFLIVKAGWPISRWSLACALLRDLMLPVLYVGAWGGSAFEWRGNEMQVESARLS